jgi:hypothetical protein
MLYQLEASRGEPKSTVVFNLLRMRAAGLVLLLPKSLQKTLQKTLPVAGNSIPLDTLTRRGGEKVKARVWLPARF